MKKKELFHKNRLRPFFIFLVLLISSVATISCNNEKKKSQQVNNEQIEPEKAAAAPTPPAPLTTLDNFPILYIEFNKITNAFNSLPAGQIKKIVFQFNFDGGAVNGQPTLNGFSAKNNGVFTATAPILTLLKSSLSIKLTDPIYMGNIELTRDEYNTLNLDPSKKTYIAFIPKISVHYPHVITYTTSWASTAVFLLKDLQPIKINAIGDELNPSPPKNPYN